MGEPINKIYVNNLPVAVIENYSTTRTSPKLQRAHRPEIAPASETPLKNSPSGNLVNWLWSYITALQSWFLVQDTSFVESSRSETEEKEIITDLNWIVSETESVIEQKKLHEADLLKKELRKLQQRGNMMKYRSTFLKHAGLLFASLSPEDAESMKEGLDSSKTSKIMTDVVTKYQDCWLQFIESNYFEHEPEKFLQFKENYYEMKPFKKNLMGAAKAVACAAVRSIGEVNLKPGVLADVLWSIWKTMILELDESHSRALCHEESELLALQIIPAGDYLLKLWKDTIKNSRFGKSHEGMVIAKWKQEAERKKIELQARAAQLAAERELACKRAEANCEVPPAIDMKAMRKMLEQKLSFPIAVKH